MKRIILLLVSFAGFHPLFSQVDFKTFSFDKALEQSQKTGKLIFLQFESADCDRCNEVAAKGFEDKELGEIIQQSFICLKISAGHPDRKRIATLYNKKKEGFGSLFISGDGALVHNYPGSTTFANKYKEEIDKALTKASEGVRLKNLEKMYAEGNRVLGFLEFYMQIRKNLQLNTDTLLDEYVSLLPDDSLGSIRTFAFVISMTPILETKAYEKLGSFYAAINKKNYSSGYPLHPDIKNRIANRSLQKAIAEKDEAFALRIALFSKNIYPKDPGKAAKAYDSRLLDYYNGVNDTTHYLQQATVYYDKYYMNISVDSIRRKDTSNMNQLAKKQVPTLEKKGDSLVKRIQIRYSPETQFLSNQLDNAARKFLELTKDPFYLVKALNWSTKAVELYDSYTAENTHALLLYKNGKKEEAIAWQEKAITLKKSRGLDTKELEKELADMKKGKL